MTSTFSPNINLEEPGHNDYVNSWDIPVNNNWTLIDTVFGGSLLLNATGVSGTVALTNIQLQPRTVQISGAPTGNVTYTVPSGVGGTWVVQNTTTGGKVIRFAQAAGGASIIIPTGLQLQVWSDGTPGMQLANSGWDNSGIHFPDGTTQTTATQSPFTSNPSGAAMVDFTGIAATVNTLQIQASLTLSASDTIMMQFYNSVGVLDTSAVYFVQNVTCFGTTVSGGASSGNGAILFGGVGTSTLDLSVWINGIQRTVSTNCNYILGGSTTGNTAALVVTGFGGRTTIGPITGVRISTLGSATLTGHVTMIPTI